GLWSGMLHGLLDQKVFKGKAPWTWHQNQPDRSRLQKAIRFSSSPTGLGDAVIDRDQALFLAGVRHRENQPSHIQISRTSESFATHVQDFAFPEQHYCPAGVFSLVTEQGAFKTRLRPQRCLHCQTCAIKDPTAAITWTPPEGGSGPHYQNM
ncbi:MAG TPA: electron transfer flavoprotein-ubiquinone oxidoreductase, partial [Magnetococcales bacterium]|nr:electron transfer flavoprotein-ubiquinone oxidoreductase [Magnetococcales bacterium]